MRLADLLEQQQHGIVERWIERVRALAPREGLPREALVDSLPGFLEELARALRQLEDPGAASALPERSPVAEAHGRQRQRLGYAAEAVAREYPVLHELLLAAAAAAGVRVSARESVLLARCMGTAAAEALSHFTAQALEATERRARLQQALGAEQLGLVQAAEARARASEERLRAFLEAVDDGYCLIEVLFDAQGAAVDYRFLEVNAAFARHTGLEAAVGRRVRELVPDLDPSWFRRMGEVVTTGRAVRFENHAPALGRWFDVFASRVSPPELRQVAVLFQDVTPRRAVDAEREELVARARRAQAEAEAERRKLHDVFEQAPVVIAITEGAEHRITFANPHYRQLLQGLDPVGKRVAEVVHDAEGFVALLDGVVASGEPFVGREVPIRLPHHGPEETGYMDFVYQPLRGPDGAVRGVLACGFEVTGQVRARRASEELAHELQVRADFEEKLIGIVGHDLRQPLQGITVSAAALLRRPGLDDRGVASVHRITSAAARMQRMLRDILDFTRARVGGGIPLRPQPADAVQLAREAAEEVELAHPGRTVRLTAEGEGTGRWDADRLRQVLDNLLTNALAYSPPDTVVSVDVDGRAEDAVVLRVHNAGASIPPELLPVLFEPLTRGAAPGGRERSVGLGLYIVRHLVQAHGGTIEVRSAQPEGTAFTVRLPRARA